MFLGLSSFEFGVTAKEIRKAIIVIEILTGELCGIDDHDLCK